LSFVGVTKAATLWFALVWWAWVFKMWLLPIGLNSRRTFFIASDWTVSLSLVQARNIRFHLIVWFFRVVSRIPRWGFVLTANTWARTEIVTALRMKGVNQYTTGVASLIKPCTYRSRCYLASVWKCQDKATQSTVTIVAWIKVSGSPSEASVVWCWSSFEGTGLGPDTWSIAIRCSSGTMQKWTVWSCKRFCSWNRHWTWRR
jgi:hypothetical protein